LGIDSLPHFPVPRTVPFWSPTINSKHKTVNCDFMIGAEIFIESLKKAGVKLIFGYPGALVLPVFDRLYNAPFKFILTRHEQAAAHAADGYARATGKPGVCLTTSGPGATNLTTGLATAHMDSIPMVAFTGQVKSSLIGNDAFQEADITGITRSITKHNYLVKDVRELAPTIAEAFYIATTGRPGPVLIDFTSNVQFQEHDFNWPESINLLSYQPTMFGHTGQIKRAVKAIGQSKRPIIYAGGGVITSGGHGELLQLAERIKAPVTLTLMGLGSFPASHPLSLGMLGMHGTAYANHAIMNSDLIIAVGARFDDRVTGNLETFAKKAKIIHIDIDPSSISKNVKVDIPIVGDAKNVLGQLLEELRAIPDTLGWRKTVEEWRDKHPLTYRSDGGVKPQYVIRQIWEVTGGKALVTTEVGQHQMWAAQWYQCDQPRSFLSSGGLGTMGFGFPAAMGAKLGLPDKTVFVIAGDGSIQMNIQELATCVSNKINVKVAIINNGFLGMVRQWQELFYDRRYSQTRIFNPDFVKLAEAYGGAGIKVTSNDQVRPAIEQAMAIDNVVFIDFQVEPEENVYPMVASGESIDKMIGVLA